MITVAAQEQIVQTLTGYISQTLKLHRDWMDRFGKNTGPLYRGISDAAYELKPGLYRDGIDRDFAEEASTAFQMRHGIYSATRFSGWQLYALMQHHGLKTKLLDWTASPLVGMFFALFDRKSTRKDGLAHPDLNAAVWMIDGAALNEFSHGQRYIYTAKRDSPYLPHWLREFPVNESYAARDPIAVELPYDHRRQVSQSSIFTVHGSEDVTIDGFLASKGSNSHHKFIVPRHIKSGILSDLQMLGINEETIFQDLDGLGSALNRQYLNIIDNPAGDHLKNRPT